MLDVSSSGRSKRLRRVKKVYQKGEKILPFLFARGRGPIMSSWGFAPDPNKQGMYMAWDTELPTLLRTLIGDLDSTLYATDRLKQIIAVAAFQVLRELSFTPTFEADFSAVTLEPDPTDDDSKNESFVNLICLKAAAIMDRNSAMLAVRRSVSLKDGSSAIDLRGQAEGWLKLLDKGWNKIYEDAKLEYQLGQVPIAGAMIMTPFRTMVSNRGHNAYLR